MIMGRNTHSYLKTIDQFLKVIHRRGNLMSPKRDLFRYMVFHEPEKFCNHPSAPPCLGEALRRGTLTISIVPF